MPNSKRNLNLERPEDKARHIYENMRPSMRNEVLHQFEDMSQGGDGGSSGSYLPDEPSIRESYYQYKTDQWFKDVLSAYQNLAAVDE